MMPRSRTRSRPVRAQQGRMSNANLALLVGMVSAAVFIVSLFKFRPF